MRYPALLIATLVLQNPTPSALKSSKPQQQKTTTTQQPTATENRGSQDSPIFIKQLPPVQSQAEANQDTQDRKDKSANDRELVLFTGILAVVGFLQLLVFGFQAYWLRATVNAAFGQSADMKLSIEQATRSAVAMEEVAEHLEKSTKSAIESTEMFSQRGEMQMRAYICIDVGTAGYQVRPDSKFAAQTIMFNAGPTPAHKVGFRAKAAILPNPLPDSFDFSITEKNVGESVLGPHQRMNITRFVNDFVPDGEVQDIRLAKGRALYIWGVIDYLDVFSKKHTTRFAQMMNWSGGPKGETVFGTYLTHHNDAD